MRSDRTRRAVAGGALAVAALAAVIVWNTRAWVGRPFPGFFVMGNRVVASIALGGWLDVDPSLLFQHQVLAVGDEPVVSAMAVYDLVRGMPPGTPVRYVLRAPDGARSLVVVRSRIFSRADYVLLFGAFFLNGVAFIATALLVFTIRPRSAASHGVLSAGLATGLFIVTAADLYGPHWFFRLHVVAESLMGAGFLHLALVFPTDRLRDRRGRVLPFLYGPFLLLAAWYQVAIGSPSAYTATHLVATASHGLSALVLIGVVVFDFFESSSALVRRRTGVVALGTVTGFFVPGVVMLASALLGGQVALNVAAFTAFLFPLSLGYAVVAGDLFEIDAVLRRGITYVLVVAAIATVYFAVLLVLAESMPDRAFLTGSPLLLAIANLALLLLFAPVQARIQDAVDRVFLRQGYDPEQVLSKLSHVLGSAYSTDDVVAQATGVLARTLCLSHAALLVPDVDGRLVHPGGREAAVLPADLAARAAAGTVIARYEWEDGSGRLLPPIWERLGAELLVPVRSESRLTGLLVLGRKESGRTYTMHDIAFLDTAANQIALALKNAAAFEEVRRAYRQLEQNQASLMRADRLATLGRLTAGLAHEVSTPLAAVLNTLRVIGDLAGECAQAIDDPSAGPLDPRELIEEIVTDTENATRWARKAAAFIRKVKVHGRDSRAGAGRRFAVRAVVSETEALLTHRLRATGCVIEQRADPEDVSLLGEPERLGQVLVNLIANAIDAYEDAGIAAGRIEVAVTRRGGVVTVDVRDWAGGIPPNVAGRVFDELFTTKEPGRGTGLGLWIARNLVEQSFGGTLALETEHGTGSCFTATIPIDERPAGSVVAA